MRLHICNFTFHMMYKKILSFYLLLFLSPLTFCLLLYLCLFSLYFSLLRFPLLSLYFSILFSLSWSLPLQISDCWVQWWRFGGGVNRWLGSAWQIGFWASNRRGWDLGGFRSPWVRFMSRLKPQRVQSMRNTSRSTCRFFFLDNLIHINYIQY